MQVKLKVWVASWKQVVTIVIFDCVHIFRIDVLFVWASGAVADMFGYGLTVIIMVRLVKECIYCKSLKGEILGICGLGLTLYEAQSEFQNRWFIWVKGKKIKGITNENFYFRQYLTSI